MKKLTLFVASFLVISVLFAMPVLAKNEENQNNGKPFQELWNAINGNSANIDSFFDVFAQINDLFFVDSFFDVFVTIQNGLQDLQGQIDSFFDVFVTIDVFDEDITNLQSQIDTIELTPGPEGPPGPQGPEGTCSCPFSVEDYQSLNDRIRILETMVYGFHWEGDDPGIWMHDNYQLLDSTKTISRCGCPGVWNCPHETFATSDGDITTFDSGPKHATTNYQGDGMRFWLEDIAIVPGAEHEIEFNITDLDARLDGYPAPEGYIPGWTLYVMENDGVIASLSEQWGTPKCKDCDPDPSSLGVRTLTFTPTHDKVSFYFQHGYGSSQCASSVYHIKMSLDYFYVKVV